MKLAIVTNNSPHHKYFILKLSEKFDIELIFQPKGMKKQGIVDTFKSKHFFMYGFFWFILKITSIIYNKVSAKSMSKSLSRNERLFFKEAISAFEKFPKERIHRPNTINSQEAVDLVINKKIDIICFLGGDIAESKFINSAKICSLNYHSGLSPYYNGNKTIFHAVKDFRPNFAGGTLMYINERIDGGGILSHFLPEITEKDTAASLFMKGIIGAVELYTNFLNYIKEHELPKGVIQQKSFKYVRNINWIYTDDIKLVKFEKENKMSIYNRQKEIILYYDLDKNDLSELYKRSLNIILSKKK